MMQINVVDCEGFWGFRNLVELGYSNPFAQAQSLGAESFCQRQQQRS